ncbi:hypothetical protein AB0C51_10470 [Streptomyces pathocidini]|uniref:hypothetical protein n=1 Tax=Streptomyces pathocidini TaxID=1650571 RepID=UPI0033EB8EC0
MTVTPRSALAYAFIVTAGSWVLGLLVDLATAPGAFRPEAWDLLFPAVATAAVMAARMLAAPLPRWKVIVTDTALYTVLLPMCAGIAAWAQGDPAPADSAFATSIFALFTLQLPAAWALIAWRSGRLRTVLKNPGSTSDTQSCS